MIGATLYERVPERLQARVLGAVRSSAWVGIPIGALLAGYLVEFAGLTPAVVGFGVAHLLVTLAPFVFPAWRQMRRPEPLPGPATGGDPAPGGTVATSPADASASRGPADWTVRVRVRASAGNRPAQRIAVCRNWPAARTAASTAGSSRAAPGR